MLYRVEAIERFTHSTMYEVEAPSPEEAERLCKMGLVPYFDSEILEGDEEWLETENIELIPQEEMT